MPQVAPVSLDQIYEFMATLVGQTTGGPAGKAFYRVHAKHSCGAELSGEECRSRTCPACGPISDVVKAVEFKTEDSTAAMMVREWARVSANGIEPNSTWKEDETDPVPAQIEKCREWLRAHAEPTRGIRRRHSSYGLKHAVERWTRAPGRSYDQTDHFGRKWTGDYFYVSNGAFIAAALDEGYRAQRVRPGCLNAFFNLHVKKGELKHER